MNPSTYETVKVSGRSGSPLKSKAPPERCGSGGGPAITSGDGKVKLVGPAGPMRPEPSPPSPRHSSRSTPGRTRVSRARARPERSPAATGWASPPCGERTSRANAVQVKS
jgi:hypothetical protein